MYTKKPKLIWQIFPSFLIIILGALIAVTWYSNRHFKHFFIENSEKELTIQARLLQHKFTGILAADPDQIHHVDTLCKKIKENVKTRVTIILPSGRVVGDSTGRIETMGSHKSRPEIQRALAGAKGVSIRYSDTLDQKMMYIALPLFAAGPKGQVQAVVRTAVSVSTIDASIQSVHNKTLIAMLLTVMAAALVSLYVSRRISQPVEKMTQGAQAFARGNLTNRLEVPDTEEFSQLARAMNSMAQSLDERIEDSINRRRELEAVHSSMQEGVIAIDNNEKIITINKAAAKIFDFPAPNLAHRNILEVSRNFELQNFIQKALSTHEPVEADIRLIREEEHILNIHSTALWDTGENRMGTLIIFHDITRIRRLEKMHKAFAANVSHELKTPLTSIKGFIETLQEMVVKNETKQALNFMGIIDKNVHRMIDIINDLLALSRLERLEGTELQFENQPLLAMVESAVNMLSPSWKAKEMEIQMNCQEDIQVLADPVLLEQALVNLVDNAIKYSPDGGRIRIEAETVPTGTEISIQDWGAGIAHEHLPKIFNRFYRVDKARSRQAGGTGLGLAIVKHIVQYHMGRIEVQSNRGKGTRFTIHIPG